MFERYTEKARRVIFFARYEASQFGSPYIETEYLLLGLLREDPALVKRFLGPTNVATDVRTEIERQIIRHESISTSVEMPLTNECKMALNLAAEESERLAERHIGTEHLLLGMLRVEGSLAAKLLRKSGLNPEAIREQLAKAPGSVSLRALAEPSRGTITALESFLSGLKSLKAEKLISFFAKNALFIDAAGKRWNHEEICKGFETLFAPYAKKNASYVSKQRWPKQASCLSLLFYGRMPFSPANNVRGYTE
jgi:ATP-dependent Clp protease ATP-binding subunit ClpA